MLRDHPEYLALGDTAAERQRAYHELFRHHFEDADVHAIRQTAQLGVPWGNDRFRRTVEQKLRTRISYRRRR